MLTMCRAVLLSTIFCLSSFQATLAAPVATDVQEDSPQRWEVYFSPKGGATDAIVAALGKAHRTVLVQAYSFTSAPIAQALVDAHKRGVKVEVLLDKSQRGERYSSADFLAHAGIPTSIDAAHAIAHNKIMVVDGETVLGGSFNFTKAAEEHNAENLLVLNDKMLADRYAGNWRLHAAHSEPYYGKSVAGPASGRRKSSQDGGAQRAIGLVKSYRNPSDMKAQPTRLGKFLEGVNQALRSKGFPTTLEWSSRRESATVFHVEAAQSHPVLVGNQAGGITAYAFHVDLQSGNVVAAPDVRPTPPEQAQSKPIVYTDTRYFLEHLGRED